MLPPTRRFRALLAISPAVQRWQPCGFAPLPSERCSCRIAGEQQRHWQQAGQGGSKGAGSRAGGRRVRAAGHLPIGCNGITLGASRPSLPAVLPSPQRSVYNSRDARSAHRNQGEDDATRGGEGGLNGVGRTYQVVQPVRVGSRPPVPVLKHPGPYHLAVAWVGRAPGAGIPVCSPAGLPVLVAAAEDETWTEAAGGEATVSRSP